MTTLDFPPFPPYAVIANAQKNATYKAAIDSVGLHYPCNAPEPSVQSQLGLKLWSSEDSSTACNWAGGGW